ncbi:tRNA lysidine(34) synthetase TilS [Geobacter sp. DSM 9736]|uniref:tRNA lysidine(34) synthetase TilS n=1 Tax=Geobacter sp. DSM 9736 TaxID=1277350 RepID=UPI000B5130D7|nr:tRNA lysidine(34) synthetase TilS [Geobacter sp. DSM 9736]SNB45142.1 tRNA(Ile)-lysidine synthase [Geobacter sp. DSM 9736]
MLKTVLASITEYGLFVPGAAIVVAVSGGADSVALLDILSRLPDYKLRLVIAHLNHHLRGNESDEDEQFVRGLGDRYRVPVETRGVDVAKVARDKGQSLEEAGRKCRYDFFAAVAEKHGASVVAVAHHADDQAETVLMRLLRGSAGTGLCGMLPLSQDGRIVRPLLGVTRREIEEYLSERAIPFRTDSSNADPRFLRNRVRHELLPLLSTYNPAVSKRLTATADALAADEDLLERLAAELLDRHAEVLPGRVLLRAAGVREEPRGGRLRLYRHALRHLKGDLQRIGYSHLQETDRLLFSPRPHLSLNLPGVTVEKSYGSVIFTLSDCLTHWEGFDIEIGGQGLFSLKGCGFLEVTVQVDAPGENGMKSSALIDLGTAPFPWCIRTFRNGDRFIPSGMSGHKKVKDLLMEAKVPRSDRRRVPLLYCGDDLLWVCGIRRSAVAPVTASTRLVAKAMFIPDRGKPACKSGVDMISNPT